jgi:hypothetical protein
LIDAGYDTLEAYLNEVNPGGVCQDSEPFSVDVPCGIGDNGEPMKDISCSYGTRVYEAIKNNDGEPACFKTSVAEDFIAGNISFTALQEGELPIITPDDVLPLNEDGEYDWTQVSDDKLKGRRIKYLSSLGVSAQSLQDNKCTLMMTEECNARVKDVDCEIGETGTGDCIDTECDQNQHRPTYRGVIRKQFGNGQACPTYTPVSYSTCPSKSIDCCADEDYESSNTCKVDGKMTYTLNTTSCAINGLPNTKEVDCDVDCVRSDWTNSGGCTSEGKQKQTRSIITAPKNNGQKCGETTRQVACTPTGFDNERFYIKDGYGNYLGQFSTNRWMGIKGDSEKTYFTIDGPFDNATIKGGINDKYCAQLACQYDSPEDDIYVGVGNMESKGYWTFEKQSDGGYKIRPKTKDGLQNRILHSFSNNSLGITAYTLITKYYANKVKYVFYLEKA